LGGWVGGWVSLGEEARVAVVSSAELRHEHSG
jgi:hypothetical protein